MQIEDSCIRFLRRRYTATNIKIYALSSNYKCDWGYMEIADDLTLTVFTAFLSFTNWRIEEGYVFGGFFFLNCYFPL